LGRLIDSIANFLLPNYANYVRVFLLIFAVPSFTSELSLASWLLVKAVKFNSQRQEKLLEDQKLFAGDLTDKHPPSPAQRSSGGCSKLRSAHDIGTNMYSGIKTRELLDYHF